MIDFSSTPIYYYRGISAYKLGKIQEAQSNFNMGLEISPYHIGLIGNSIISLGKLDRHEDAFKLMSLSKRIYPELSKPQFDMAKIYIMNYLIYHESNL